MAEVKLTNVKKMYDNRVVAVQNFNLTIKDKEFIVIVGPSGCGKSTTMRMIAGLEDISDGTIEIDGVVVNDLEPRDRDVAMVFQNYALYPHLSVFDNMAFALQIRKVPRDEIYERVKNVAETLGITEYLSRKPRALSGGQRQRVAIGRAMVRESKVFLLDEPLSNLDAKLRNAMRAELIALRKKIDSTFIYVTHDQTEAMTLGDRIVIMKDGQIQQVGTPEEVFNLPYNLFVAGFIGAPQMNFFNTKLVKEGDKYYVTPFDTKMELSEEKEKALVANGIKSLDDVILGVRPEHITVVPEGTENSFAAKVDISEMMGSEVHLHVICPNDQSIVVRVATLELSPEEKAAIAPGQTIYLHFTGNAIHVFGSENARNLTVPNEIEIPVSFNEMGDTVYIEKDEKEDSKERYKAEIADLKEKQLEEYYGLHTRRKLEEAKIRHEDEIADLKAKQAKELLDFQKKQNGELAAKDESHKKTGTAPKTTDVTIAELKDAQAKELEKFQAKQAEAMNKLLAKQQKELDEINAADAELKAKQKAELADLKAQQKVDKKEAKQRHSEELKAQKAKAIEMEKQFRQERKLAKAKEAGLVSDEEKKD